MAMIYDDCELAPSRSLEQSAGKCHTLGILGMLKPWHFLVACWLKDKLKQTCTVSDQLLSNVAPSQQRAPWVWCRFSMGSAPQWIKPAPGNAPRERSTEASASPQEEVPSKFLATPLNIWKISMVKRWWMMMVSKPGWLLRELT